MTTNHAQTNTYPLSPKDRERQLTAIRYMLLVQRLSQKEIAQIIGISAHTVGAIVRRNKLKEKAKDAIKKGLCDTVKYDESLTAFMVKCRTKHAVVYPIIETIYKQHLADLKKNY